MKRFIVLAALLAVLGSVFVSTASAYYWPMSDKMAFTHAFAPSFESQGYRWPYLYTDCLQKTAQNAFPSYRAYLFASAARTNQYLRSNGVFRCITQYGDKWWD